MAAEPRSPSSRGTLQVDGSPRPLGGLSFRVQGGHSSRPKGGLSSRESSRRGPGTVSSSPRGATEPQYTVYIRLPFPRNGFVDPPRVEWDAAKERYLWKVISRGNRDVEVDWDALAQHLQVSRAFLLQQAAWLYERELSQIQAQMRRMPTATGTGLSASNPAPALSSPATPVIATGATPVFPIPATAARPNPMSAFNGRQVNGKQSREEGSGNGLPAAGLSIAEPRVSPSLPVRSSSPRATPVPIGSKPSTITSRTPHRLTTATVPSSPDSSSSSGLVDSPGVYSSDDDSPPTAGRSHGRLPTFLHSFGSEDEGGDGDSHIPAFLPFSASLGATVTLQPRQHPKPATTHVTRASGRVDSAGPSSPSMGSSFSDLSDASVSQSAMEEAFLSTINAGGVASRMSTIGQAVRSRYFQQ